MPRHSPNFLRLALFAFGVLAPAQAQVAGWTATPLYNGGLEATVLAPNNLIQASDGNFYGTNNSVNGEIVRITPGGVASVVYAFTGNEGSYPGSLVQGADGALYGTAQGPPTNTHGIIFRCTLAGVLTTLHAFDQTDGDDPDGLIVSSDGGLYGTTYDGGPGGAGDGVTGYGVVFKLSLTGTYTMIGSFLSIQQSAPTGDLVEGTDGNLYGILGDEGNGSADEGYGSGQIFQIVPGSPAVILYDFGSTYPAQLNPLGPITEGVDGRIYTLAAPPDTNSEELFSLDPTGKTANSSVVLNIQGEQSGSSGLIAASDGNFFTSTAYYAAQTGFLYKFNDAGVVTEVANLGGNGVEFYPAVQGMDGNFYGFGSLDTAYADEYAEVRVGAGIGQPALLPPPVQISLSASSIQPGQSVTLSWNVNGAYSSTAQECVAGGSWSGKQRSSGRLTASPTVVGNYTFTLTCGGNRSGMATLIVNGTKVSTTTTVLAAPKEATAASVVNFVATVDAVGGAGTLPQGAVTFSLAGTPLIALPLVQASASYNLTLPSLPPGSYPFLATYGGDATHTGSSATANVTIQSTAVVNVSVSPNPVVAGTSATLTVSVLPPASGYAVPTGTVQIYLYAQYEEAGYLGTFPLNKGKLTLQAPVTQLNPGLLYQFLVAYSGDSLYLAGDGQADFAVVPATKTVLSLSSTSIASGQALTLSAAVQDVPSNTNVVSGTVNFYADSILLEKVSVQQGVATSTLVLTGVPAGTYSLSATYSGDANDGGSSSAVQQVIVTAD